MKKNDLIIFKIKKGEVKLHSSFSTEEDFIWASQKDLVKIFEKDQSVISRHIKKIFKDGELKEKSNMHKMHIANSDKPVEFYSLDVILSVGYRTNSKKAIEFRKWASKILKQHITKGYTLNKKVLKNNQKEFLKTIDKIKFLSKDSQLITSNDTLELVKTFSSTWFNLESFDKQNLPKKGNKKIVKNISFKKIAEELSEEINLLKKELIRKKEATDFFALENKGSLEGILGNIFQSFNGSDVYETVEEKSAHILYFVIKNHPFTDGNKRTGAFCFVWFLKKMKFNFAEKITPEALTTLTLLIAESNPEDKEKMVGLVLLLLKK